MADQDLTARSLEGLARAIDRRKFLRRTLQLGFGAAVGIAWGSFGSIGRVLADQQCSCQFPNNGVSCSADFGYTCPSGGGCPSGCAVCNGCECVDCCYASGWWYSCGCGITGGGCRKCYDCICPSSGGCSKRCGCRSACICCNCRTAEDFARELKAYELAGGTMDPPAAA